MAKKSAKPPKKGPKKSKSVESASRKRKTEAQRPMNEPLVSEYVKKLQASLGNADEFLAVFEELQNDHNASQPETVAIGSEFVAPMAASTPRAKALERILKRHKNLMSFKLRQKAVGGRSAA